MLRGAHMQNSFMRKRPTIVDQRSEKQEIAPVTLDP